MPLQGAKTRRSAIRGKDHPSAPVFAALAACLTAAAACSAPRLEVPFPEGAAATPTPAPPVATPPPAMNVLTVCLAEEPNTLYLYGSPNASAQMLLPALYDGPFDVLGYVPRPVIVEGVPSTEAGSLRVETVSLVSGDLYFNPETLLPDTLAPGKPYLPSGCTSLDCARNSQGGQIPMDRQVAEFRLLPDLVWSDGTPLTARDSVFSFDLDADPGTPSLKDQVHRTSAYEAVDDRTVRWTGIPGYYDPELAGNFWTPLPEHILGDLAPQDLPEAEAARRAPIGWGPYLLESWVAGRSLEFVPNENYRLRSEGWPAFDRLHVRVIGPGSEAAVQQVLTGECDVLEESLVGDTALALLDQVDADPRLRWSATPGIIMERLDFGTDPVDGRPAILASPDLRRALAACIDRQGLIDTIIGGLSPIPQGMIGTAHPLAPAAGSSISYDPVNASAQLTALGWIDDDGESATPRVAQGADAVPTGTPLRLGLLTSAGGREERLAHAVAEDLEPCGVALDVETMEAERLYAPWPDSPVFGRAFDLVVWPWLEWVSPACELFTSAEVPSDAFPQGSNASGFADGRYDAACAQAGLGPAAEAVYFDSIQQTHAILNESVPSLPLFQLPRILVTSAAICDTSLDPTAPLLWNLERLGFGAACSP